jgi:hypothetical protein
MKTRVARKVLIVRMVNCGSAALLCGGGYAPPRKYSRDWATPLALGQRPNLGLSPIFGGGRYGEAKPRLTSGGEAAA